MILKQSLGGKQKETKMPKSPKITTMVEELKKKHEDPKWNNIMNKQKQVNSLSNLLRTSNPRVQVENLLKVVATKEMDGNP
jgi:hypothetical protein